MTSYSCSTHTQSSDFPYRSASFARPVTLVNYHPPDIPCPPPRSDRPSTTLRVAAWQCREQLARRGRSHRSLPRRNGRHRARVCVTRSYHIPLSVISSCPWACTWSDVGRSIPVGAGQREEDEGMVRNQR